MPLEGAVEWRNQNRPRVAAFCPSIFGHSVDRTVIVGRRESTASRWSRCDGKSLGGRSTKGKEKSEASGGHRVLSADNGNKDFITTGAGRGLIVDRKQ